MSYAMRRKHRQQQLSKPANTFAELDRLELVAALLERDAINNRAWLTELGKRPPYHVPRWIRFSRRGQKLWIGSIEYGHAAAEMAVAVVTNRKLIWVLRAAFGFTLDLACVLAAMGLALSAVAVAYALLAPPV